MPTPKHRVQALEFHRCGYGSRTQSITGNPMGIRGMGQYGGSWELEHSESAR